MATSTRIAQCPAAPPIRVPHLMPFHIRYSGPAPMSTYFRIQPLPPPPPETNPPSISIAVETQPVSTVVATPEEKEENAPAVSAVLTTTATTTAAEKIKADASRPGPI